MPPSLQTIALTLAALAIGTTEGLRFQKRVDASNIQGPRNILITNAEQSLFYTPMQIGTGSSLVDIFGLVSTTRGDIILPGVYAQNASGFVNQGKSLVEGPIYAGPVSAARWTVPDQDIIYYENPDATLPIEVDGQVAYAGFSIWPNTSTVYEAFNDWSADSFISRVLAEPAAEPYWTLLITPLEDDIGTDGSFGGLLTIGELVNVTQIFNIAQEELDTNNFPNLELVADYPPLNNTGSYDNVIYYAVIDAIKWGDVSATLTSTVPGTPAGKTSAYIDSTYSWIEVPYSVTEQLYAGLEGATYNENDRLWYFQCTELSVNITIAGWDYPLSPLTAVKRVEGLNCVGTFQAKPQDAGGDVVLGVPFLKNVYARFAYATRSDGQVYDPYAQLMPLTNVEDARNDWVAWYARWSGDSSPPSPDSLAGQPTLQPSPLPSSPYPSPSSPYPSPYSSYPSPYSSYPSPYSSYPSPYSSYPSSASDPLATGGISGAVENDGAEEKSDPVKRYLPAIIVGSIVGGLALTGGIFFAVRRMRKGRDGKGSYRGLGVADDMAGSVSAPLVDSEAAGSRYGDGGQGRYTDPYKD